MKHHTYYESSEIFGLEALEASKIHDFKASKAQITSIRRSLLDISKQELDHFKLLECKHTFIKEPIKKQL